MATDSSAAGYLAPSAASPYDEALGDLMQAVIKGITGIAGTLVRPRWQTEPSNRPAFNVNWVSFGLVRTSVDAFGYERHSTDGLLTYVERDELLYVLHSFYGPNAHGYCERFRDGLELPQNRDEMRAANLALVEVQEAVNLPSLLKEKWVQRVDTTVIYRRRTSRTFPVLTIESAEFGLNNELYVTPIVVDNS